MTTQIAVKLPDRLVAEIDELVAGGSFASRSEAVRHSIEALVRRAEREHIDRSFVDGFRRYPESDDEMADATRLGLDAINDEPWERWW